MISENFYIETKDLYKLYGSLYKKELNIINSDNSKNTDFNTNEVVIFVHGCTSSSRNNKTEIFAQELNKENIDYFSFDNRGYGIINKVYKIDNSSTLIGAAFEDILESNYDIEAAVDEMIKRGYKKIYLLGHSLGCTKILYWLSTLDDEKKKIYNEYISNIGLLSLVDISSSLKKFTNVEQNIALARQMVSEGKNDELMPKDSFISLITCSTYLNYCDNSNKYNFVDYIDENYEYEIINSFKKDIFIRFGTIKEIIPIEVCEVVRRIKEKVNVRNGYILDIKYIENANHSYYGKEKKLIKEYIKFLRK